MILPTKHIRLSESLLGLGSFVIQELSDPKTIDEVWSEFIKAVKSGEYPFSQSFENLILAIDLLYVLGAITTDDFGRLVQCSS